MHQKGQQPTCSPTMLTCHQYNHITNWYLPVVKDTSPIMQTYQYRNNMQTLSEDHINMQTHQKITSLSVNPDKQVDIIIVICIQHINKYISRHSQIRVAKCINREPFALQYSSLSPHPKFQFSDWDPLDTCLYYYMLIMQTLHPLI